ncbi:hypothetical protein ASPWEDRAFT_55440 [Aspergillus wentii DTO 134E9]|uniref:Major facilitator superfamily (MFS) profile domain-containing protein n=1 Tax=Aspergillus wentii DTO 134E9 TaxID=1073089 RepID=A0A1L9R4U4_ASPWE|nr:uncharacterized protein ASPWEDRAFT_55440 [Aspergillus wentii DTO 134E9]OJJ29924.1 hypothetical protein ASPWEDRAFT_55440 [Aspergillus wentii DTO 134E9]
MESHEYYPEKTPKNLSPLAESVSDPFSTQSEDGNDANLPPVDRGFHAWMFLISAFIIEGIVWGYSSSYGVFQNYYETHEPFQTSGNIAVVGTCATGLPYLLTPIVIALVILFPRVQCYFSTVGHIIMCVALAAASFSKDTTHLILSQGVAFGIGGCLAFTPAIVFMNEWFVERKGFAFGVVWGGSGLTGIILPIVLQALLSQYGWQTTLRASSVGVFILGLPFLFFLKPRNPTRTSSLSSLNMKFQLNFVYIVYQLGNTIEAIGYFLPAIFMPSHARRMGHNGFLVSVPVVLFNLTTIIGCAIMGKMTDRYHVSNCILMSTVGAITSIFLIWGLATSLAPLYIFSIMYGLFAGGFSSTWSAVAREINKNEPSADTNMVIAFMETGRGIGFVLSGPLSGVLLKGDPWKGTVGGAYGSGYGPMITFTGFTALMGGLCVVARAFKMV